MYGGTWKESGSGGGVVQGELVQMEEGWMGGRKDGLSVRGLEE